MINRLLVPTVWAAVSAVVVAAEPAADPKPGESDKAAAIAKLEAEIEAATASKATAAKDDDREAVKRLVSELKRLRLEVSKAKARPPESYAAEAAERAKTEEQVAFWANPKGRATVAAARLYRDLQAFRKKPDFAQFGFGRGGPYHLWMTAAETVSARDGKAGALKMMEKYDCSLGELAALGMEYASSGGKETAYTTDVERRLGPAMQSIEKEAEERERARAREKSQDDASPAAAAP